MSEQTNLRVIKGAYSSFKNGDIEGVLKVLSDDVEWISPGPPELMPLAGERRGRAEVAQFFSTLSQQEDVEKFEIEEYVAQADKVIAFVKYRARVKETGKTVESELVHVFTFRHGKVKRFREYFDTAAVLDAYRVPAHLSKLHNFQRIQPRIKRGCAQIGSKLLRVPCLVSDLS